MRTAISATSFARIVGRDPKTVIRWIENGLIPGAKRVGDRYEIPATEIEVYQKSSIYPTKQHG